MKKAAKWLLSMGTILAVAGQSNAVFGYQYIQVTDKQVAWKIEKSIEETIKRLIEREIRGQICQMIKEQVDEKLKKITKEQIDKTINEITERAVKELIVESIYTRDIPQKN